MGERPSVGHSMSDIPPDISHDQYAVRLKKLQDMRTAGTDPFRANAAQTHFSGEALKAHVDGADYTVPVKVAGRLVVIRDMGKSQFVKILDQEGQLQLYVKKDLVGDEAYAAFKKLDLGDIIGAEGHLFKSKTGEITVRVDKYTLVSKALRPLPEKWHGLSDMEQVYRQRYLDLIVNEESRKRLMQRSRIVASIRATLAARKFFEVETPVLEGVAGGAAARPFTTHHNALGADFFLRIALELRLKRLLVGGYDRVFEIGRVFRNEGVSRKHNPEFTMLEVYQAYSDFRGMMALLRAIFADLCRDVIGATEIKHAASGQLINFAGDWREVRYYDLIDEAVGLQAERRALRPRLQGEGHRRRVKARPGGPPGLGDARDRQRDLRQEDRADAHPADLRHAPAEGALPAGQAQRRGPGPDRRLRVHHRRHGGGPGLLRAERPVRAARDVREAGRRREAEPRQRLPARP
jgi:lysyl-tRNA synthetase class 2